LQLIPADTNPKVLNTVYTALLGEKRLDVRYTPRGPSAAKSYEISPRGIVVRDVVTYLVRAL
jgi:predicted DNA-binding transcriptional regulator YafY